MVGVGGSNPLVPTSAFDSLRVFVKILFYLILQIELVRSDKRCELRVWNYGCKIHSNHFAKESFFKVQRYLTTHLKHFLGLAVVLLLTALFKVSPFADKLNGLVLDYQFQGLRQNLPISPPDNIVIVGIDDHTYEQFDRPSGIWHGYIGEFLLAAANSDVQFVVVDLLFEKLYKDLVPNHYANLHRGLLSFRKKEIPLVLGVGLAGSSDSESNNSDSETTVLREVYPYAAIRAILRDKKYYGLAIVEKDSDGVLRRQIMSYDKCQNCSPSMLSRIYEQQGQSHRAGLIDFSLGKDFDYFPLHQVIEWYRNGDTASINEALSGKAVFLGTVAKFEDRHLAPLPIVSWETDNRQTPGVLFMAQAMRSINNGGLIQPLPLWIVGIMFVISVCLWFVASSLRRGLCSLILWFVLVLGVSTWLLTTQREMPTGLILFAALAGCLVRASFESWQSFKTRMRLSASFGAYVSPQVMQQILQGTINPNMAGRRQEVCVMFSDIRNFTSRSESQPPEEIIELLNLYFEEMTEAVDAHGGTIDKFIGDGLMVFFGAPNSSDNPARDAFETAKSMMQRLERINLRLIESKIDPIQIGIGLHVGEAIIGHVGSSRRHEYTAIGDTINIAARLEGLTKTLKCHVACSNDVYQALPDRDGIKTLGDQAIKGRSDIQVFGWSYNTQL